MSDFVPSSAPFKPISKLVRLTSALMILQGSIVLLISLLAALLLITGTPLLGGLGGSPTKNPIDLSGAAANFFIGGGYGLILVLLGRKIKLLNQKVLLQTLSIEGLWIVLWLIVGVGLGQNPLAWVLIIPALTTSVLLGVLLRSLSTTS